MEAQARIFLGADTSANHARLPRIEPNQIGNIANHRCRPPINDDVSASDYVLRLRARALSGVTPGVADELRALSAARTMSMIAGDLVQGAERWHDIGISAAETAIADLKDILANTTSKKTVVSFSELGRNPIENWQSGVGEKRIPSGLASVDQVLHRWHPGQYTIIAARPSMGKSMLAVSSFLRTAMRRHGVMLFSHEMIGKEILQRALTDLAYDTDRRIAYSRVANGDLSDLEQ